MSEARAPNSNVDEHKAFLARYERPLRAFFAKRLDRPEDTDDLLQELLTRLWSTKVERKIENPDGYIFQAAANLLNERYRKAGTRRATLDGYAFRQSFNEEITPERILQGKDELHLLELALAELPPRTRTVFLLHRFEGLKYREIAERIGVSASAVEKHIATAARHIAHRLDRT
ncbi:RNA polymerase sigma factor [Altererythrobacter lutimaris]|uniref:RNA polymerase sigma factor n=1 Tax=Altererythrobacter lutimaris TaxID=2743979 RepID=A0A850HEQ5_9SPHN|nr:RNA polymerase sigma factor [Altererythrobacter lutimaris]NVE96035.1 RNA polymerase sigma factor [Altererythrobacter lutimaris]